MCFLYFQINSFIFTSNVLSNFTGVTYEVRKIQKNCFWLSYDDTVLTKFISSNSETVWKMLFFSQLILTEIDKTKFLLPRSHTSFKNHEIWNLAIILLPRPNKSDFVEFRGRMQNVNFQGRYNLYSDLSENSFSHNFCFLYETSIFQIR